MTEEQAIAAETLGALNISQEQIATAPAPDAGTQVAAVAPSNPEISDEQNFDAVAERQSIESDAERLERNRQTYQVAAVEAGLDDDHTGLRRACAEFGSADRAQIAFLESGGPKRDRKGLDPDGDGFACFWNPAPFRSARGG